MRNCIYKEESISAFIVKDEKEYEKRVLINKEIRDASRTNQLICEECGHPVVFRSGEHRHYFAHKDGFAEKCEYEESYKRESKVHREGKEALYDYFHILYPDAKIRLDYRLPNKRRANIYIEQDGCKMAVEFERFDRDVKEWEQKEADYRDLGIISVWVYCETDSKMSMYEQQVDMHIFKQVLLNETKSDVLIFLNTEKKEFILIKSIEYRHESTNELIKEKLYKQKYGFHELEIMLDGTLSFKGTKSFSDEFEEEKKRFIKEASDEQFMKEHNEKWDRIKAERANKEKEEKQNKASQAIEIPITEPKPFKGYEFETHKYRRIYETKILNAVRGDEYSIKYLMDGLHNFGAENYYLIIYLFKKLIETKYEGAEDTYQLVMRMAGMDPI